MSKVENTGRLPSWIRTKVQVGQDRKFVGGLVQNLKLHTVCQSAKCPNLSSCWHARTATVMILGDRCTRRCKFCAVPTGGMLPPDLNEPEHVAAAASEMGLKYIVLTSVDRDDLPDLGAGHWAKTIAACHKALPDAGIEVLTPDFQGKAELIEHVADAGPTVYCHNMETCERLSKGIRSGNQYHRSLNVLEIAKAYGGGRIATKSGIMVGLGETDAEVEQTIRDIHASGVDILTIGQYLRPSREQIQVDRYVHPTQFEEWQEFALKLGFKAVSSSPMVRSSYRAEELARQAIGGN